MAFNIAPCGFSLGAALVTSIVKYEDRITCFLDLLGFKNHIAASTYADGTDSIEKISALAAAFNSMRQILDTDRPDSRLGNEVTQFSDSVVISFQAATNSGVFDVLLHIMWVQASLVFHGILCRGGIARGKLVHTSTLLFGPALLDAYALESQAALYRCH